MNNNETIAYIKSWLKLEKWTMPEAERTALENSINALEKQNKLQLVLDIVDREALNLQIENFPEGCEYFRGFRAGMCQAVERIDDLMNGDRM